MPTITRKIELTLCTDGLSDEQRKAQWGLLYRINDNLYKAANNISSKLYLDEHVSSMVRLKHDEYLGLKKELAKAEKQKTPDVELIDELREKLATVEKEMSDQELAICKYTTEMATNTLAYRFANEIETGIFGQILATMKQGVHANFQHDSTDVKRGKRAIRTYKRGMAIPFPWNDSIRLSYEKIDSKKNEDDVEYEFYLNWFKDIKFRLHFGKDRSNNRLILKRCFNLDENCEDEYCIKTSSIKKGTKGSEYYLFLVVDIPQEKHVLNNKIVVGVDLGINYPAYVATNITEERKAIGDREHFLKARMAFSRRYRSFQRLTGTAGGRGRAKKLEPLERLREKERNWVHTQNHLFSRDVVQFAIQVKAATIQMEDLSGYGRDEEGNVVEGKKFLLGKWSYYELQSMIKYKAQKAGIRVHFVNPAYTSQTCSECGQVQPEARNSVHYICQNPACKNFGKDIQADYNAAINIARSNNIIKR